MNDKALTTYPGDYIGFYNPISNALTALLTFGMNELNLRSLVDDPPGYILESASDALGKWSARKVLPNGSAVELALIQFKKDERTRGRDDVLYGEWTIHIKGPATANNPDGMILVFLALHDYVWIKGISQETYPSPPRLTLPPPSTPPGPSTPPPMTPQERALRERECDAIEFEMGFPIDPQSRKGYVEGRHNNVQEIHDDMLPRGGVCVAAKHLLEGRYGPTE